MAGKIIEIAPKELLQNPVQPRGGYVSETKICMLAESIKVIGLLKPPIVLRNKDGNFVIIDGHVRVRACIQAKIRKINVIVENGEATLENLRFGSENLFRTEMGRPNEWKSVERVRHELKYSDARICASLGCSPTYLKQLQPLSTMYRPIVHAIELGRGPDVKDYRMIATACFGLQSSLWIKHRLQIKLGKLLVPDDARDGVNWRGYIDDLVKEICYARDARFDIYRLGLHLWWPTEYFEKDEMHKLFTLDGLVKLVQIKCQINRNIKQIKPDFAGYNNLSMLYFYYRKRLGRCYQHRPRLRQ